jgi:DNA (cytosine-5)-methyltransferase 1
MRHLDLFSGIGGFALAAGWAGFETIGFAETDAYCSKILDLHWPGVVNYGDVHAIDGRRFQDVDLVTAGFPCQPFSCAGQRRGTSDERFLWPELARLLGEVRPRFALLENVPGILSMDGGRIFGRILGELAALGFDASWNCVPASAVGALHRRDRLWIVVNGDDQRQWELRGRFEEGGRRTCNGSQKELGTMAHTNGHQQRRWSSTEQMGWFGIESEDGQDGHARRTQWAIEPNVGRLAYGVPSRVDRLKGLGNAIVPQLAYIFLDAIAQEIKICG